MEKQEGAGAEELRSALNAANPGRAVRSVSLQVEELEPRSVPAIGPSAPPSPFTVPQIEVVKGPTGPYGVGDVVTFRVVASNPNPQAVNTLTVGAIYHPAGSPDQVVLSLRPSEDGTVRFRAPFPGTYDTSVRASSSFPGGYQTYRTLPLAITVGPSSVGTPIPLEQPVTIQIPPESNPLAAPSIEISGLKPSYQPGESISFRVSITSATPAGAFSSLLQLQSPYFYTSAWPLGTVSYTLDPPVWTRSNEIRIQAPSFGGRFEFQISGLSGVPYDSQTRITSYLTHREFSVSVGGLSAPRPPPALSPVFPRIPFDVAPYGANVVVLPVGRGIPGKILVAGTPEVPSWAVRFYARMARLMLRSFKREAVQLWVAQRPDGLIPIVFTSDLKAIPQLRNQNFDPKNLGLSDHGNGAFIRWLGLPPGSGRQFLVSLKPWLENMAGPMGHELGHELHDNLPSGMYNALTIGADLLRRKPLYSGLYAGTNPNEYVAEATRWLLDPNYWDLHSGYLDRRADLVRLDPQAVAMFDLIFETPFRPMLNPLMDRVEDLQHFLETVLSPGLDGANVRVVPVPGKERNYHYHETANGLVVQLEKGADFRVRLPGRRGTVLSVDSIAPDGVSPSGAKFSNALSTALLVVTNKETGSSVQLELGIDYPRGPDGRLQVEPRVFQNIRWMDRGGNTHVQSVLGFEDEEAALRFFAQKVRRLLPPRRAAGTEEESKDLREQINLLPPVQVPSGVGVIAAGLEGEEGLAYGLLLDPRMPVVFLSRGDAETQKLIHLGAGSEEIFQIGTPQYPTLQAGVEQATAYLREGWGMDGIVFLGVFEKVSPLVRQVLESLGFKLDLYVATRWNEVLDSVVNFFRQA